jgi:predicted transcriptional regulator
MKRPKVKIYLDILKALTQNGPLKLTHLMLKSRLNCTVLNTSLDYLIEQGLVEKRIIMPRHDRGTGVWAITQRGFTMLKYYRELTQALPLMEEAIQGSKPSHRQIVGLTPLVPSAENYPHSMRIYP